MRRIDTRAFFRPLCHDLVSLLRSLAPDDWDRPTLAGSWRVRDVTAHLLDTALRRLSFHRDHLPPLVPEPAPRNDREFVAFINTLNAEWVLAARRLSPRVLTDLYECATTDLAAFVEAFPDDGPALFPVSWAGHGESPGWFDLGREFTEIWHHGSQIREAVGAGPFNEPAWLRAVLALSVQALPHAYRDVAARAGTTLAIRITGPAGGSWLLRRGEQGWTIHEGNGPGEALVTIADHQAWRVLYNALSVQAAAGVVQFDGDPALAAPFLRARSVIV